MNELNEVVMQMREEGIIAQIFEDYGLNPDLHMITNDPSERLTTVNTR